MDDKVSALTSVPLSVDNELERHELKVTLEGERPMEMGRRGQRGRARELNIRSSACLPLEGSFKNSSTT